MDTSLSFLEQLRHLSDSEAWNRLVSLYTPLLQNWLRYHAILPPEDVDDLIQDVLLAVARDLPAFEHNQRRGAFRSWLRGILVNRLRDFWRTRQNRPGGVGGSGFQERLEQLEDEASNLSAVWNREHDQYVMDHLLREAETQFPPHVWQAFHRQVREKAPPATVAEELNMSLSAVYAAKSRVLGLLRKLADGVLS